MLYGRSRILSLIDDFRPATVGFVPQRSVLITILSFIKKNVVFLQPEILDKTLWN